MIKYAVSNIDYDLDDDVELEELNLPTEFVFEVDEEYDDMNTVDTILVDMISDETGWCVASFEWERIG